MHAHETVRHPVLQGRYWRQSRSAYEVDREIQRLKDAGLNYLASCIEHCGRWNGPHVTNAEPGYSWHQWGEAMDAVWFVNGYYERNDIFVDGVRGYQIYADEAAKLGLNAGFFWNGDLRDHPHVQRPWEASPQAVYPNPHEVDRIMKERFGGGSTYRPIKVLIASSHWSGETGWAGRFDFLNVPPLAYAIGRDTGTFVYPFDLPDYPVENSQASVTATLSSAQEGRESDVSLIVNETQHEAQRVQAYTPGAEGLQYQWAFPETELHPGRNVIKFRVAPRNPSCATALSSFKRRLGPSQTCQSG